MASPFGEPDSSVDHNLRERPFIPFGHRRLQELCEPTAKVDSDTAAVRVVSGHVGTGKSHCARRIEELLIENTEGALSRPSSVPQRPSMHVLGRLKRADAPHDPEYWAHVWRAVLLTSTLSHLKAHGLSNQDLSHRDLTLPIAIVGDSESTLHPYSIFPRIADQARNDKASYFEDARWIDAESRIATLLKTAPVLSLVLDNLDEFFDNDPKLMAALQAGLTRCVIDFEKNHELVQRLEVRAAIRPVAIDLLFSSNDRRLAFTQSVHYVDLYWTSGDLAELVRTGSQKALNRPDGTQSAVDAFADLAGIGTIVVPERGSEENLLGYVVRHTGGTPRDIVTIGNLIAHTRTLNQRPLRETEIKGLVSQTARSLGQASLIYCANDLSTFSTISLPASSSRVPTAGTADKNLIYKSLVAWLASLKNDIIGLNDLLSALDLWFDESTGARLLDELWRHRLVGTVEDERAVFCRKLDEAFPYDQREVVFPSFLIEACQLSPVRRSLTYEF